jgi:predicted DCC family thiol-disulfide oxidoreductase YuxK
MYNGTCEICSKTTSITVKKDLMLLYRDVGMIKARGANMHQRAPL